MRIVAEYRGEEIVLKKYTSYLELDKDLSSFNNYEDLMKKIGLDSKIDSITILDNNKNAVDYDFETARKSLSFYEQKKGDEFVRWIFYSACNNYRNKNRLLSFVNDRILDFTKNDKNFDENSINNNEGKRLYSVIQSTRNSLIMFGTSTSTLEMGRNEIIGNLENYVKKDNRYDYAYMRKFAISLKTKYKYNFNTPKIMIKQVKDEEQVKVLDTFKASIQKYIYQKNQITIDELTRDEVEPSVMYDINGEKIDEMPFDQETIEKAKNLHL